MVAGFEGELPAKPLRSATARRPANQVVGRAALRARAAFSASTSMASFRLPLSLNWLTPASMSAGDVPLSVEILEAVVAH